MTNAEKYADKIAQIIADDPGPCTCFDDSFSWSDGIIVCEKCQLNKICNDSEKIKKWLLSPADQQ